MIGTVSVPGAGIYMTTRGAGPHLLIVPGGDGDADTLDGLVAQLVDRFTVITYDRRGLSRSTVDGPPSRVPITTHADDARRVLAEVTDQPVFVFGTSMGALIGLEMLASHSERVAMLVAHEPPLTQVLPPARERAARAAMELIESTYRADGLKPAMTLLSATTGIVLTEREPGAALPRPTAQRMANLNYLLRYDTIGAREYHLDVDAVRGRAQRLVVASGTTSRGGLPYQCAETLALLIERPLNTFPGGHTGYATHPRAFAERLRKTILD